MLNRTRHYFTLYWRTMSLSIQSFLHTSIISCCSWYFLYAFFYQTILLRCFKVLLWIWPIHTAYQHFNIKLQFVQFVELFICNITNNKIIAQNSASHTNTLFSPPLNVRIWIEYFHCTKFLLNTFRIYRWWYQFSPRGL